MLFNIVNLYKSSNVTSNKYYLTETITLNHRLDGNSENLKEIEDYIKTIENEKVFIYPILIPRYYILSNLKTIDKLYSNDHFSIIMNNEFLRDKLLKSIKLSKPKYLIKMKSSMFDKYISLEIENNYTIEKDWNEKKVYKRKTSK